MRNSDRSKVAVIMSVYRSDDAIAFREAANSILNQTYPCDLYIYRDGPVPESIQTVIDEVSINEKVQCIQVESNLGLAKSLNTLLDTVLALDYEYIARMDSDDISRKRRIEKQIAFFNENTEVDVCGTSCREFGATYALEEKKLPLTHAELLNFSIARCPFIHPTVMFRSNVFKSGTRYPTETVFTEDMALWFELLKLGHRFGNLDEVLLDYRLSENTIERRKGADKALSEIRIRMKNMFLLKQYSFINTLLICSRLVFHLMPSFLVKLAYKKAR